MPPTTTQVIYSGSEFTLTTPSAYVPPQQSIASSAGLPAWNTTPKYRDAGDTPFLFSPELEAATAAKLKAALQISPVTQPSTFTSGNNYMVDGVCTSNLLPRDTTRSLIFASYRGAIDCRCIKLIASFPRSIRAFCTATITTGGSTDAKL